MKKTDNLTDPKKTLIVLTGPTAVGKTALCVRMAENLGTEIISADSRQFYRDMQIGTARPTEEEMRGIKHHFTGHLPLDRHYSVGDFERDAIALTKRLFEDYDTLLLTGGSGFYIKALLEGMDDLPPSDSAVRADLERQYEAVGLEPLRRELREIDPDFCAAADLNNRQRVLRALEVFKISGKPFSSFHQKKSVKRPFKTLNIVLERPREELYERINTRVDMMLQAGLLDEVKALYPKKHLNALQTVGYTEFFDFMDGKHDFEEAVRLIKRNTRRYAKRQMTWFRRQLNNPTFLHPDKEQEIRDVTSVFLQS